MRSFSRLVLLLTLIALAAQSAAYSRATFAGPLIDINTASADVLAGMLPGIGPTKAKAIVDYRDVNGPFQSLDELTNVKGIGVITLNKIRPYLFQVGQGQEQSRLLPSVISRTQLILNASGQNSVDDGQGVTGQAVDSQHGERPHGVRQHGVQQHGVQQLMEQLNGEQLNGALQRQSDANARKAVQAALNIALRFAQKNHQP